MEVRVDLGPWGSVFAVPTALVDKHLKLAGKEQLQVLLWALRRSGQAFTSAEAAQALSLEEDAVLDALDYWQDAGLLLAPGQQPAAQAAPQPAQPAQPEKPALPAKRQLPKPDAVYLAKRRAESEAVRYLLDEAQSILGILSPAMTSVLLASCDDYGLAPEAVIMLIQYAKGRGKTGAHYIESVARDWAESGVTTLEAAERKLRELEEKNLAWAKVSSVAGLPKRAPTKKEEEAAYRWVTEWQFSGEMLAAAYERCADHTGKFSAAYMDKVLARWQRQGIKNTADLEKAEQKQKDEQKQSKTYDIDELERLSFFNLPEEL